MAQTHDYSIDRAGAGLVFTLRRPAQRNALNDQIWTGLESCMDQMDGGTVRFLVVTAQGEQAFSAGSDLKEGALDPPEQQARKSERVRALLLRLSRMPVFSIAAINGLAYGGGLELAMACTVRSCIQGATFAMPEIRLGVIPAYGGTQFLPATIGRVRAAELMLTGRVLDSATALNWGLVSHVHADGDALQRHALQLAAEVGEFGMLAYQSILHCVQQANGVLDHHAMAVEARQLERVLSSADANEGIRSFLEKRRPIFTGR